MGLTSKRHWIEEFNYFVSYFYCVISVNTHYKNMIETLYLHLTYVEIEIQKVQITWPRIGIWTKASLTLNLVLFPFLKTVFPNCDLENIWQVCFPSFLLCPWQSQSFPTQYSKRHYKLIGIDIGDEILLSTIP